MEAFSRIRVPNLSMLKAIKEAQAMFHLSAVYLRLGVLQLILQLNLLLWLV